MDDKTEEFDLIAAIADYREALRQEAFKNAAKAEAASDIIDYIKDKGLTVLAPAHADGETTTDKEK